MIFVSEQLSFAAKELVLNRVTTEWEDKNNTCNKKIDTNKDNKTKINAHGENNEFVPADVWMEEEAKNNICNVKNNNMDEDAKTELRKVTEDKKNWKKVSTKPVQIQCRTGKEKLLISLIMYP